MNRHKQACYGLGFMKNQALLVTSSGSNIVGVSEGPYESKKGREMIAKMIIVHEYPFRIVEHEWFNRFCMYLNPMFEKCSRNTIKKVCMHIHENEKVELKEFFRRINRISLTSDYWTSNQIVGYMCLTAHFIDEKWKLGKRIINFYELEPPHSGVNICYAISHCLQEWGIQDKVQSITLHNAKNNDLAAEFLRVNFVSRSMLKFDGLIFHVRCCAHILNLMVQDGLEEIEFLLQSIRESVKYLKKSPGRLFRFGEIAKQLVVPTSKGLCSDCPTRWNSTYKMLDHALAYKTVFTQYAAQDANYQWVPSNEEWERAEKICEFLEIINDVTELFSGTTYATSNLFFHQVWCVRKLLLTHGTSNDVFMKNMAVKMSLKFDKYWGDANVLMAIAAIYPRSKVQNGTYTICFLSN